MRRKRWIVFDVDTDANSRARLVVVARCRTQSEANLVHRISTRQYGIICIPRRGSARGNGWPTWVDVVVRRRFHSQPVPRELTKGGAR